MSIFDTLAENRYQQWIEDKARPDYVAPDPVTNTANRTSFEAQLYQQMMALLDKAEIAEVGYESEKGLSTHALLTQAQALHIQLTLSLEKKQLPLVAATLARSYRQRIAKFYAAGYSTDE